MLDGKECARGLSTYSKKQHALGNAHFPTNPFFLYPISQTPCSPHVPISSLLTIFSPSTHLPLYSESSQHGYLS